jgi:hypothetical protein
MPAKGRRATGILRNGENIQRRREALAAALQRRTEENLQCLEACMSSGATARETAAEAGARGAAAEEAVVLLPLRHVVSAADVWRLWNPSLQRAGRPEVAVKVLEPFEVYIWHEIGAGCNSCPFLVQLPKGFVFFTDTDKEGRPCSLLLFIREGESADDCGHMYRTALDQANAAKEPFVVVDTASALSSRVCAKVLYPHVTGTDGEILCRVWERVVVIPDFVNFHLVGNNSTDTHQPTRKCCIAFQLPAEVCEDIGMPPDSPLVFLYPLSNLRTVHPNKSKASGAITSIRVLAFDHRLHSQVPAHIAIRLPGLVEMHGSWEVAYRRNGNLQLRTAFAHWKLWRASTNKRRCLRGLWERFCKLILYNNADYRGQFGLSLVNIKQTKFFLSLYNQLRASRRETSVADSARLAVQRRLDAQRKQELHRQKEAQRETLCQQEAQRQQEAEREAQQQEEASRFENQLAELDLRCALAESKLELAERTLAVAQAKLELAERKLAESDALSKPAKDLLHDAYEDADECSVCFAGKKTHALAPCGHRCVCGICAVQWVTDRQNCPICREPVQAAVHVFDT